MDNSIQRLKAFYQSGSTRSYKFRVDQLQRLKRMIQAYEEKINQALLSDLGKNAVEVWVTEISFVLQEIDYMLKHLSRLMKTRKIKTNLVNLPSSSRIIPEPLGLILIISPWNYPLNLSLTPLVGAIAAGNVAVIKPSEQAPALASLLETMITENFPPDYIRVVQGEGHIVIPELMRSCRFDHIFFTGSRRVGTEIYQAAAKDLIPVTLELGGKSPCVVEAEAAIGIAAKRIAVAKFVNAGQTCVAPDYILVDEHIKEKLVAALIRCIKDFYTTEPIQTDELGKIINEKQYQRLKAMLGEGRIIYGGKFSDERLKIEPTLMDDISSNATLMKEEIFGPILPVISFKTHDEALAIIQQNPDPLAFYLFTLDAEKEKQWLGKLAFGGGCINNAAWHLLNPNLPFGGIGMSGMGSYHGEKSFEVFTHFKSILKTPNWFDPRIKYPPYKNKLGLFKRLSG